MYHVHKLLFIITAMNSLPRCVDGLNLRCVDLHATKT